MKHVVIAVLLSAAAITAATAEVLINEIDVNAVSVELWNRGETRNMTGWRLVLIHQDYYGHIDTVTYAFKPGYSIPADGMVLVIDGDGQDDGPLLYHGAHWNRYYEFSLALYDADGKIADYMDTDGFGQDPPDSSVWTGPGCTRTGLAVICRVNNGDTGTRDGWNWYECDASVLAPNPGQTERKHDEHRYAGLVINELARTFSGSYSYIDHVELWNRGDSLDMTGWTIEPGYGAVYTFPAGFTIAPGRFITLQSYIANPNDSTLSMGSTRYGGSIVLRDADGGVADYFYGFTYQGPAGEGWYGDGPPFGDIGVQRIRDKDTDTPFDWGELDSKTDEGKINPGQHHAVRLHASPASYMITLDTSRTRRDTLRISNTGPGTLGLALAAEIRTGSTGGNGQWVTIGRSTGSLAAGGELAVPVMFDRAGEVAGTYCADIVITHNMRDGDSVYSVPCTLTVAPVSLVSVPDSAVFNDVIVGGNDTAYVPVMNTGTEAVTVDSLVCGNPFSAAGTAPFTIAACGTVAVPVTFEPAAAGYHAGLLTVYSGAGAATVALAGTGADGPVLSVSVTELSAAVDSGDTFATSFTLTNTGSGTLHVAGHYDSHPVVINEVRNGTWVEFRNRGPARSLAGWKLKWTQANSLENPEYAVSFTFPDTAVIPADGYIGVTDYYYYANGVFMDMNGPQFYGWITSYTLLDSSGNVVDYLERDIMRSARPAGARWYGAGFTFTTAYITRPDDRDTDTRDDWKCVGENDVTRGLLNKDQSAGYRTSWLTLKPGIDTALAAGGSVTVGVILDARNAAAGRYTDLLRLGNDGARPAGTLPVTMAVGTQRYLAALESDITFPRTFPMTVSYDTLYLRNPGTDTVTVTGISIVYYSPFKCNLVMPVSVPGGGTLAVPLAFMPGGSEYTWNEGNVYVYSDAVDDPAIRLYLHGTAAKAAPVITSVPATQAVEDAPYSYRVTATDAEALDTLIYSLVTAPAGMGIDRATGLISWVPGNGQAGWNAVSVRVSDGTYYDDQAFSVYVVSVNDAPVIVPVGADTAFTSREYARYVNVTDEDDPVLAYSLQVYPAGMTVSAAGLIRWTPGTLLRDSTVTVAYRVADAETSAADTFRLHIRDLRLLRTAEDTVACAGEYIGTGAAYNGFTLHNDGQHTTTVSSVVFSDPSFSLFNAPPFGVSPGYPSTRYIRFRPAVMGTVTATATVYSDAMDHPVLQFTVTGTGLNTAPRITSSAVTSATEDEPYSYQLTAADDEIDTAFVYALAIAPAGMSIDSAGLVAWTPVDAQYGDNDVVLTVSDGFLADTQRFVITVARVNDPPVLLHEPVYDTAYYGVPYSYPIPVVDEEGDSLMFSLTSPPAGMRVTAAGEIVWLPLVSMAGTWQPVIYSVSDGDSVVSGSYMLYVADQQRLMSVSTDTLLFPYTPVGQASQCTLLLQNTGTAGTGVSAMPVSNGVFTASRTAPFTVAAGTVELVVFTYAPALAREETGTVSIVSDAIDHPDISILLRGVSTRRAPYFTSAPVTSATEDSSYTYQVAAADDPGDVLTFGLQVNPAGMAIDPSTGLISWTPGNDDAGDNDVTVRVTDGVFVADQQYTLYVQPVNDPPVITPGPAADTTREGDMYSLLITASDEEDDSLRYGFADSPPGMTIDGTGTIRWNVPDGYGGFTYPVTYTVSDGEHTVQASYLLAVEDVSGIHPPAAAVLTADAVLGGNPAGSAVRFLLQLRHAADVQCGIYSLDGQRVFGTAGRFASGAGQIVWQPDGAAGMYYYVITADDAVVTGSVVVR